MIAIRHCKILQSHLHPLYTDTPVRTSLGCPDADVEVWSILLLTDNVLILLPILAALKSAGQTHQI
jgi:hypothetical protein